jgi:hypothetical protein
LEAKLSNSEKVSALAHLKRIKALRYVGSAAIILVLSSYISVITNDWGWVSRAGGVITLLGALLTLRKLFRVGAQNLHKENEPLVINKKGNVGQFNLKGMFQRVEDLSDAYAQALGLAIVTFGTVVSSYGDKIMEWLVPLSK